jgi:hypothetical protein
MPVLTYYDILDIPQASDTRIVVNAWDNCEQTADHWRSYVGLMDPKKKRHLDVWLKTQAQKRLVHISVDPRILENGGWISFSELEFDDDVWPILAKPIDGKIRLLYEPRTTTKAVELYVMPGTQLHTPEKTNPPHDVEIILEHQSRRMEEKDYLDLKALILKLPMQSRPFVGLITQFVHNVPPRARTLRDLDMIDYSIFRASKPMVAEAVKNFLIERDLYE